jgi:MSHA biogenesis protein MshQ
MRQFTALIRSILVVILLAPCLAHAWKMEAGTLDLPATSGENELFSFSFKQTYASPPIVVALPTDDGPNASALRIRNVTSTGFEIAQVEPFSEDGPHTNMTVSYVAVEPGVHQLPDGTRIEAGLLSTRESGSGNNNKDFVQFGGNSQQGQKNWGSFNFSTSFSTTPVVIGDIQTMTNETNAGVPDEVSQPWFTTVFDAVTSSGFNYALELSEAFDGSGGNKFYDLDNIEQIGFIAISPATASFRAIGNINVLFESQSILNGPRGWDDGCSNFVFNNSYGSAPIAVASKTSRLEEDGGWLRQCQISNSSIGLLIDEDTAQDSERNHVVESVGLVAFSEPFAYDSEVRPPEPEPLMMESRSVTVNPGAVTRISFQQVYPSPPAVFVLSDDNNPEPSAVRIRQISEDGFDVVPLEPPTRYSDVGDQNTTVHYLAVTYGEHTFPDGTRLEVGQVPLQSEQGRFISGSDWSRLNFLTEFGGTPVFISNIQTLENETSSPGERSVPWLTMAHDRLGASGIDLALERAETTSGSVVRPETIAYLAIEPGVIGSFVDNDGRTVLSEAQITPDNISGTNSCDSAPFLQSYPSPPRVVGSQLTRDGGDGGWLRRCSVSNDAVELKIEEDWANDRDLSHTTERAGFLAFSGDFAVDFSLRAVYGLEGPRWQGDPGEVVELRGTGLDGRAVNGARAEPAKVCYGATLSGGSFIDIPHDDDLSSADELTVMAWINVDAFPTGGGIQTIVSKDENYEYHVDSNRELYWWWTNESGVSRSFTSGYQLPLKTWVHTAITYSKRDGVQRIVIDGVERARQSFADESLLLNTDPFQIGADQGFGGREFEGQIDEVRFYARALSDAAILREANRSRPCAQVLDHFRITVPATASVCAPVDVRIRAEDAGDNVLTGYQGTMRITTSAGHGNWQKIAASGSLSPSPDVDDDGDALYEFVAADNGEITLGLENTRADRLTIRAEETTGGQFGISSVVEFRENALVIALADSLGNDVIAGRLHGLQAEVLRRDPSSGECGRVEAYDGAVDLRAWLNRETDDPAGSAPGLDAGAGSISLPSSRPATSNLTVDFDRGLANLGLIATDVGHYALELEDSESGLILDENDDPIAIAGTGPELTARPFAFAVTVAGNPATDAPSGTAFRAAGRPFDVSVRAVQYDSADDADADGQPDGHGDADAFNNTDLTDNASVDSFDAAVSVAGYLIAGPAGSADPGLAGLSGLSGFSSGSASGSAAFNEVGAIEVATGINGAFLGRAVTVVGDSGPVGRFHPERFSLDSQMDGVLDAMCNGFNYTGQSFGYGLSPEFIFSARAYSVSGVGPVTRNYRDSWQKLTVADIGRTDPAADADEIGAQGTAPGVTTVAGTPTLIGNGDGTLVYQAGADTFTYDRNANSLIGPFDARLETAFTNISDSDGVSMPTAELPTLSSSGASIRYGRMVLENAYGPETLDLAMPFEVQIWNGTDFELHSDEICWAYNTADAVITDMPPNTSVDANSGTINSGRPAAGAPIRLTAPGEGNTGNVQVEYPVPLYWQSDFDGDGVEENPQATATFGVYRGHDRVIYWQER